MMEWLYRIVTKAVDPIGPLAARLAVPGDATERAERLGRYAGPFPRDPIWMHAASAGEVVGAAPIAAALGDGVAGERLVVTTMTRTGRKRAAKIGAARTLFVPADLPGPVGRAFDAINPSFLLLVETEVWPNLIREAARRGVPVAVVNGRLSGRSFRRMAWAGPLYRKSLGRLSFCGVQRDVDASRFRRFGVDDHRIHVHGNTKIDALPEADDGFPLRRTAGERWVVFGSVRPGAEEEAVRRAAARLLDECPDCRVAVAPRHPEKAGPVPADGPSARWRRWSEGAPARGERGVWVDTVGDLVSFYALADVAFVGGSLSGHGGHNPAEPARFGVPVLFGPRMENSREFAEILLEARGASVVRDGEELTAALFDLLDDEEERRRCGEAAREAIESRRGASRRCVEQLRAAGLLPPRGEGR